MLTFWIILILIFLIWNVYWLFLDDKFFNRDIHDPSGMVCWMLGDILILVFMGIVVVIQFLNWLL